MKLSDLIDDLIKLEDSGHGDDLIMALAPGTPPMSIHHVEPEYHEDSRTTTIWIRAEEI